MNSNNEGLGVLALIVMVFIMLLVLIAAIKA